MKGFYNLHSLGKPAWYAFGILRINIAFACLLVQSLLAGNSWSKDITVQPNGPVRSIQQAVQMAVAGDRILVKPGLYQESQIVIAKRLTILGLGSPVIDGGFKGEIFSLQSDSVHIEGLVIKNVEVSSVSDYAAIRISRHKHCIIRNNRIENAFFGIYLEKADSCTVQGNQVIGNAKLETSSGNAIHLWYSMATRIEGNQVRGHRDGIYLEFVQHSVVSHNLSTGNLRYGLHFMFSNNNHYLKNQFRHNGAGVAVMYSKEIEMTGNTFEDNWGPAAYGILLKDITDSRIEQNIFRQNTVGIHAEGSNRIEARYNEFRQNGWGVRIMGSCDQLNFSYNNFIANTFEIGTNNNYASNNSFTRNYWSNYRGYDLNKDGFGDVAHRPVKMFSYLNEKVPTSIVLLRSLFVDLLELAEQVAPVLTPTNLADSSPKMKKNQW